jgi:hypothetical protein
MLEDQPNPTKSPFALRFNHDAVEGTKAAELFPLFPICTHDDGGAVGEGLEDGDVVTAEANDLLKQIQPIFEDHAQPVTGIVD